MGMRKGWTMGAAAVFAVAVLAPAAQAQDFFSNFFGGFGRSRFGCYRFGCSLADLDGADCRFAGWRCGWLGIFITPAGSQHYQTEHQNDRK